MSNRLDSDQTEHFERPDLGPICCKGYEKMTLVGRVQASGLMDNKMSDIFLCDKLQEVVAQFFNVFF